MTRPESTPRWWAQPFPPEGAAAAEGIKNQLGKPTLDPLTVLVREAVQNSWDARLGDRDVSFAVRVEKVGDRAAAWSRWLAPGPHAVDGFEQAISPDADVIIVSDRGTRGLGGPVRADAITEDRSRSDFVQFIRNVGEPRGTALGGGTYGFGKGIFFRLSSAWSILVDSNATNGGRRLIGSALGNHHDHDGRRFTGRHWWGTVTDDIPDPLLGPDAEAVARELGLPGFSNDDTGTDIVILGAALGTLEESDGEGERQRTPAEAGEFIASAILWHLWPKMSRGPGEVAMTFEVTVDGTSVVLPRPELIPELRPFVAALDRVRHRRQIEEYNCRNPKLKAAALAIELVDEVPEQTGVLAAARPFEDPLLHHIARMRPVELVVDYHPGPVPTDGSGQYAGVFMATADADRHFADSEPPTHDAWNEASLADGDEKRVVRGAARWLEGRLKTKFGSAVSSPITKSEGLGALSAKLGKILHLPNSKSGGTGTGGGGGGGRIRKPRLVEGPAVVEGATPYLLARFVLPERDALTEYRAEASVVLDRGSRESEPPAGAPTPQILQWLEVRAGANPLRAAELRLEPGPASEWWVYARHLPDAVQRIEVVERRVAEAHA